VFRAIADFEQGWAYEREATLKVLRALSDASLNQAVVPGGRTLGRLAWHTVQSLTEMMNRTGLQVSGPAADTAQPATATLIAEAYEQASKSVADAVMAQWKDQDLPGMVDMYGEQWTRSQVLASLIVHQAHHRGQMTVLMRQAGLTVPGVYGPSREEWAIYGMTPQE
jgi:uncharacterized damage-inducible protein DinB